MTAGMYAAFGIMLALRVKERTGRGQAIDVSMLEGQMSLLGTMIGGFLADGELPAPMGTAYKALLPYQTFRTKTRDLALAVGSEKLWQIFCPAIGRPELANDPRYRRNADRAKNRATLIPLLQEVFLTKTYEEWEAIFLPEGIPFGAINNIAQVVEHPQVQARGTLVEMQHPRAGKVKMVGAPVRLSETPGSVRTPSPMLGEHTAEVLRELLGDEPGGRGRLARAGRDRRTIDEDTMSVTKLLIANRGEIAIRIARAAADMGLPTVAVYSEDDSRSLHLRVADEFQALPGQGAAAYLNAEAVIAAATASGCDAIHPGYGFLAERGDFARMCAEAGLTFVGPDVAHLELFGDKARARTAAVAASVPVIRGLDHAVTLDEARAFFASLRPGSGMIVKALAGGGGRGTRVVLSADELEAAFERCRSEAGAAFGRAEVYVEEFLPRARHVEVQILGDREGGIAHLGERECSIQRRLQKIVEIAPAPALDDGLRGDIIDAAVRFAKHVGYTNLGTFEFLVDVSGRPGAQPFVFIEANARLQVEHTVTEAVTGVDLVQAQIRLAQGATLKDLGLDGPGDRPTAWLRDPDAREHGNHRAGRLGAARRRHVDRLRGPERAGRADGRVRLCGLPYQRRVRLIARQGHRPGAGLRGGRGAVLARPQRIPAGGRRHQHRVPPQHPGACRLRRRQRPYPLGRREHGRAGRRRSGSAAPLRGGGAARGQRWRVRRGPGQESRSARAVRA